MTTSGFWDRIEAQLAETPLDLSVERDSFYSQPEWDVYQLRYNTTGGHRLYAWLSVPKGISGPVPTLVRMPDYASVHDIIYTSLRHNAVVMNATHRGQRNSDGSYRASYPGLLTDGIADGESWVLLGAYADALRALDALVAQDRAEIGKVALWGVGLGGSLALALASRRRHVGAVAADTPMPLGHDSALDSGPGYPLGEIGDFLRFYPDRRADVEATLGQLDPLARCSPGLRAGSVERGTFRPRDLPAGLCRGPGRSVAQLRPAGVRRSSRGRRPHSRRCPHGLAGRPPGNFRIPINSSEGWNNSTWNN